MQPPETTGVSPDFDRYFRAQMNTLEALPLVLPALWIAAFYSSATAASVAGFVWCVGRVLYANGYYKEAKARGPGFGVAALAMFFLLFSALLGVGKAFLK